MNRIKSSRFELISIKGDIAFSGDAVGQMKWDYNLNNGTFEARIQANYEASNGTELEIKGFATFEFENSAKPDLRIFPQILDTAAHQIQVIACHHVAKNSYASQIRIEPESTLDLLARVNELLVREYG